MNDEAEKINAAGGEAIADEAKRQQLEAAAQAAIQRFGRIDTWINDAGVAIYGRLDQVSEEDSRRLSGTNFGGVVNGSLTALPHLLRQGGALINVGSQVSEAVVLLQGMYSASKHAVKGFTDTLRIELNTDEVPILVTLIQPTAVNTPYPQHARNYLDEEPKLPTPQIDPQDVADAILHNATNPTHHVKVGIMVKVNTLIAGLAPSLADKMSAVQIDRQHYDEAPRDPQGALHAPTTSGQTQGSGGRKKSSELRRRKESPLNSKLNGDSFRLRFCFFFASFSLCSPSLSSVGIRVTCCVTVSSRCGFAARVWSTRSS